MKHRHRSAIEPDARFAFGIICCFGIASLCSAIGAVAGLIGHRGPTSVHDAFVTGVELAGALFRAPLLSKGLHERLVDALVVVAPVALVTAGLSTTTRTADRSSDRHASFARRVELGPLLPDADGTHRLLLGYLEGQALYAEKRQSLLVIGPSQSGKTTGIAIPAITSWDGPVLATSVKGDLVEATASLRHGLGTVSVFDPSGVVTVPSSSWSPLCESVSWKGARRVAAGLCAVARSGASGLDDAGFWYATAEKLLAPLLFAAATAGLTMHDVVRWVDLGEVDEVLDLLEIANEPDALRAAEASFSREERQRSSVYTTAETVIAAFCEPGLDRSAGAVIDPAKLLSGAKDTLYLVAPAHEQQRLQPVFVALLKTVLDQAFDEATRRGGALGLPLLVVLDEAANVAPISGLDTLASTAASHGIQLLTVFQDISQIEARYGQRAASVVNNHRAKLVCSGVGDPVTLEQMSALIGEEEHATDQLSVERSGNWTRTESPAARRLAPADWIRRLPPGHALVLYGHLPPFVVELCRVARKGGRQATATARRWRRARQLVAAKPGSAR